MANFTGLAAGPPRRSWHDAGWDVDRDGLTGAPRVRVLVGAERHDTVDLALRYLGLGRRRSVAGRRRRDASTSPRSGRGSPRPTARRSCACRPATCTRARSTRSARPSSSRTSTAPGCTWTARSGCGRRPRRRCGTCWPAYERRRLVGDRRAQDAERRPTTAASRSSRDPDRAARRDGRARQLPDPRVRAARPVTNGSRSCPGGPAASRSGRRCGRSGAPGSRSWSTGLPRRPGDRRRRSRRSTAPRSSTTSSSPRSAWRFGDDERTRAVTARLLADGTAWMSGSRWHGRDVLRVSVSNWSTDAADVDTAVAAVRRAADPSR